MTRPLSEPEREDRLQRIIVEAQWRKDGWPEPTYGVPAAPYIPPAMRRDARGRFIGPRPTDR